MITCKSSLTDSVVPVAIWDGESKRASFEHDNVTSDAIARIRWLSSRDGGRTRPPIGPTYTTVARFAHQGDQWAKDAWSLVIEFLERPDQDLCHLAKVRFLAENSPSGWLEEGSEFELLEGPNVVARGTIGRSRT